MTTKELEELKSLTMLLGESIIHAIQHSPTVWSDVNSLERRIDERYMKLKTWVESKSVPAVDQMTGVYGLQDEF